MSSSSTVSAQQRLIDQTLSTIESDSKLSSEQKTALLADVANIEIDQFLRPDQLQKDVSQLKTDVYSAEKSKKLSQQQGAQMLTPAIGLLAGNEVEQSGPSGTEALIKMFEQYCQASNTKYTGEYFSAAWKQFSTMLRASFPDDVPNSQFADTVALAKSAAENKFDPATQAEFQQAVNYADQAYVAYQAAKNNPKDSAQDKKKLANIAFGKMMRAYEIGNRLGMDYSQFTQALDKGMGAAFTAVQKGGQSIPKGVTATSVQKSLDTWLSKQTDLDRATVQAEQHGGPETGHDGANFGSGFSGWLHDATKFDAGKDPFEDPTLSGSVAPSSHRGATMDDYNVAAASASDAYAAYFAAKKAGSTNTQTLANIAFGKIQRAYEIASNLDTAPGAYDRFAAKLADRLQQKGETAAAGSLSLWLLDQYDLDAATKKTVHEGANGNDHPETENQGANFGLADLRLWTQDAAAYDGGKDPFANPLLNVSNQ